MTVHQAAPPAARFAEPGTEEPLWPELDHTRPPSPPEAVAEGVTPALSIGYAQQAPEPAVSPSPSIESRPKRYSTRGRRFPARPMTPEEVAAIIGRCSRTSATGIRNRALLTLLYRSGLRINEALSLRVVDLDTRRRSIDVDHGKGDVDSVRFWHSSADDALTRWLDTRRVRGLAQPGVPVFCTLQGGPVADVYVRNLVRRLGREAGIERRVHPHSFRHTFAFELERSGKPVSTIAKLLGHARISTTARYLDHLTNRQAGEDLQSADLPSLGEN